MTRNLTDPPRNAVVIVPNDDQNLTTPTRALHVGAVGGSLRVLTVEGQDVTFTGLEPGSFVPVQVRRVFATNTTCTGLVGLW